MIRDMIIKAVSCITFMLLASFSTPSVAGAMGGGDNFDTASAVSDEELDTMRGGSLQINGVTFDFSYFSRLSVTNDLHNIHEVHEVYLTSQNLNAADLQQLNTPMIVQNSLAGSVIENTRVMDVVAQGAIAAAAQSNLTQQINFSALSSVRGM